MGRLLPQSAENNVKRAVTRRIHASRLSNAASDLQLHAAGGRLRVAVYSEFFPVAYRDPKTKAYKGLDVDIIEGFCRSVGLTPVFVRVAEWSKTWSTPEQWNSRVDVAIGGIGRSDWRNAHGIEWTIPYFSVRRTVVYNLKDPIRRFPEDVTGVVAGTMGTTGMTDALSRIRAKFGGAAWDHVDARWKSPDATDIDDLLKGKIQGLMRGSFVGKAIVARHPRKLGMAEPWDASPKGLRPYGQEVFAFPCRRGSGVAAQLNTYLMHLSQSGKLYALTESHGMGI
jgi:ABC-type amino acid transport substrate-binding protein